VGLSVGTILGGADEATVGPALGLLVTAIVGLSVCAGNATDGR
jgi:hypothetical protein